MYAIDLGISLVSLPILQRPAGGGGGGGGGAYTAPAVHFDGTNDLMGFTGVLTGVVNTKVGIMSYWAKNLDAGNGVFNYHQPDFYKKQATANGWIFGASDAPANIFNVFDDEPFLLADGWRHYLASWNTANNTVHMFVDDLDALILVDDLDDAEFNYAKDTTHEFHVQDTFSTPGRQFDYADYYINMDEYLDITIEANRRKFINASGKPVDLGTDGSTPTTNQPTIFMTGSANIWNAGTANKGYSSAFAVTGAVEDAASSPSD